jgi:hypothetical protein
MIDVAVVTTPEGTVKGPERVLPRNSVFKMARSKLANMMFVRISQLYWF